MGHNCLNEFVDTCLHKYILLQLITIHNDHIIFLNFITPLKVSGCVTRTQRLVRIDVKCIVQMQQWVWSDDSFSQHFFV